MNKIRNKSILQRSVALAVTATVTWTFALFPAAAEAAEAHRIDKAHRPVRTTAQILAAAKKQEALRESRMPHFPYVKAAAEAAKHPIHIASDPSFSILDEVGKLGTHVSNSLLAQWRRESSDTTTPEAKLQAAKAHLHIGEWELSADHNPRMALKEFHLARSLSARKSDVYGLASYDSAVAQFYSGAYADATDQFKTLVNIHTALPGYPRQDAAMWLRHAGVCAAYHRDNSLLGIPEPPKLDPFCGAASLAACLKTLHVPYTKADVLKVCRVDGEGSNAQDIIDAAGKLGLVANFVGANEKGLINLPKPVVAFVERDHFVAVTKADAKGVSYLCSDCGAWPGGQVDLTWQQWRALNASQFVSITRPGSAQQKQLAELIFPGQNLNVASTEKTLLPENETGTDDTIVSSHPSARLASWTPDMHTTSRATFETAFELPLSTQHQVRPMMAPRLPAVQPDVILTQAPAAGTSCGATATALPCVCVACCAKASGGPPMSGGPSFGSGKGPGGGPVMTAAVSGASAGDPVNLANGQEEYTPTPDITVYNPHGPAVSWSRIYSSLRPGGSAVNVHNYYQDNDYGVGWSQAYNVSVYDPTNGATGSGNQKYVVYPNGSRAWFTASAVPTPGHPVQCTVQSGFPILVEWDYDSAGGSLGHYTITFQDRTKWITSNIVTASSIYSYPLAQITDRNGNSIYFNYSASMVASPWPLLSSISTAPGGAGTVLLNIVRSGDGTGNICLINDCYGRSVYYHVGIYANANVPTGYPQANPELDHVSQIVPSCTTNPPDRYAFGYQLISNLEGSEQVSSFLHTITVPSPTGIGTSTATINYDPTTDFVSSIVDANGNQKIFTSVAANGVAVYPSNFTKTVVKDSHNAVIYTNTVGYDTNMSQTSQTDGTGRVVVSEAFVDPNDPFRPSQVRDGIASISVPQGSSLSIIATGTAGPSSSVWDILNPSGTIIASNTSPGTPPWSVTYVSSSNQLTVSVPAMTSIGNGYIVRYAGGFSTSFNVITSGSTAGVNTYTWDQYGNRLTETSPRGTLKSYTFNYSQFALGELTQIQQGSKAPTKYFYNEPSGLVSTILKPVPGTVNGTGYVTYTYTYNLYGDITQITEPRNDVASSLTYTFDYGQSPAVNQVLTATDNIGNLTHQTYDNQGNLTSTVDANNIETDFGDSNRQNGYNIANQRVLVTYPTTNQVPGGRAVAVTAYIYPGGPSSAFKVFGEDGNQVSETDTNYGNEGEVIGKLGSTFPTYLTYDALYRRHTVGNGNGNVTTYSYTSAGYLGCTSYPGAGGSTSGPDTINNTSYDANGNVLTSLDGRGVTTTYTYNDPDRKLTNIHYTLPPNPPVSLTSISDTSMTYDQYGRRVGMVDASGTYAYSYDDNDSKTGVQTSNIGLIGSAHPTTTLTYTYWPGGGRKTLSYGYYTLANLGTPLGTFNYSYDLDNRLNGLVNPFNEASSWAFMPNRWLASQTSYNSSGAIVTTATYTRNARGFISSLANANASASTLSAYGSSTSPIGYNALGDPTSQSVSIPAVPSYGGASSYAYDQISGVGTRRQLVQETSTRGGGYTNGFAYDGGTYTASTGSGNPTTMRAGSRTYNSDDQITGYTYDGAGNLTSYNGNGLSYDPENRLASFSNASGVAETSTYDGNGHRASIQTAVGTIYYVFDDDFPIISEDNSGSLLSVTTNGLNGVVSTHQNNTSTFYTWDTQGNLAQKLDASGTPLYSRVYDAFGNVLKTDGDTDPYSSFGGQWGYFCDITTGLLQLGHRFYDPSVGRFLTRDPLGYRGGTNLYCYTGNDPLTFIDPTGYIPTSSLPPGEFDECMENCREMCGDMRRYGNDIFSICVQGCAAIHCTPPTPPVPVCLPDPDYEPTTTTTSTTTTTYTVGGVVIIIVVVIVFAAA